MPGVLVPLAPTMLNTGVLAITPTDTLIDTRQVPSSTAVNMMVMMTTRRRHGRHGREGSPYLGPAPKGESPPGRSRTSLLIPTTLHFYTRNKVAVATRTGFGGPYRDYAWTLLLVFRSMHYFRFFMTSIVELQPQTAAACWSPAPWKMQVNVRGRPATSSILQYIRIY